MGVLSNNQKIYQKMRNISYGDRIKQLVKNNLNHNNEAPYVEIHDVIDIFKETTQRYLEHVGLSNVEPHYGFLDSIKLYTSQLPVFLLDEHAYRVDDKGFINKEQVINYLVENLVQNREIVLYQILLSPLICSPINFEPYRSWLLRCKIIASTEKIKKDFLPIKNIPLFNM